MLISKQDIAGITLLASLMGTFFFYELVLRGVEAVVCVAVRLNADLN